jgi:hypothetical protein
MLIEKQEGGFSASNMDLLCILFNEAPGTYHPAFFEESPLPGPIQDNPSTVRLKSKFHHTSGFQTLEEAQGSLIELSKTRITGAQIIKEPIGWNGEIPLVWIAARDTKSGQLNLNGLLSE